MSRIPQLERMLESRPDDPFVPYALGIEHANDGALELALQYFERVAQQHPQYVPTYLHYGQTLEKLSRYDEALSVYDKGIEVAEAAQDGHALSELRGARELLESLIG